MADQLAEETRTSTEADVADGTAQKRPLRWWPAFALLAVMLLLRLLPTLSDSPPLPLMMVGVMGPAAVGVLLLPWWLFASRASLREKLVGIVGLLSIAWLSIQLADQSMRGMPTIMHQLPVGVAAFGIGSVLFARRTSLRLPVALLLALVGFGVWDLLRFDGVTGSFSAQFSSRWAPTPEEEYLESLVKPRSNGAEVPGSLESPTPIRASNAEWPGFRGGGRNSVVPGVVLDDNWDRYPPKLVWKSKIGPGWSSFSVAGHRLFTQEQSGDSEAIVCLDASSGGRVWSYEYTGRFWESIGGAGPRATPTLGESGLYSVGADGAVVCLAPASGELIWQRSLREDAGREPPMWGWASSPLVVGSTVIVYAGGDGEKGVFAYDALNGNILWSAPSGNHSYSSAQLAAFDGVEGALMVSNDGLRFLSLRDGRVIWTHEWRTETYRVLQPLVEGSAVLFADSMGDGTRRVTVSRSGEPWKIVTDWTSRSMKPQYNDFVLYDGHLYGFDHNIFACIDIETGERNWKRGRYGNGQVLLLDAEGQLLLTSERGEIVLVEASPEKLIERAKFPAIEGKTWNHPVLVGDRLFLRNGQEAACYELPLKPKNR